MSDRDRAPQLNSSIYARCLPANSFLSFAIRCSAALASIILEAGMTCTLEIKKSYAGNKANLFLIALAGT